MPGYEKVELRAYLSVLARRWWIIALLVLVGTVSAALFSVQQPPRYRTTTVLLLNPAVQSELISLAATAPGVPAQPGSADRLARSYDQYLKTNAFTSLAVERLSLQGSVSPRALSEAISTALVPSTDFFTLSVTWGNRQQAQLLANGVARIFIEENRRLQLASRPAAASSSSLADSLAFYERRVNALRLEREELEGSTRLTAGDRRDRLADVETRLLATEDTYVKLLSSATQARALEEGRLNTATVVDEAPVPGRPVSPNVLLNVALAAVAALAVGVGLVILLDYLDDTIKSGADVQRVAGADPLAVITTLSGASGQGKGQGPRGARPLPLWRRLTRRTRPGDLAGPALNGQSGLSGLSGLDGGHGQNGQIGRSGNPIAPQLITYHQPGHPVAEAFRMLRTNVEFSLLSRPDPGAAGAAGTAPAGASTLVVASAMPGEGKTTIASNLALVFARAGKRVLLIDADLRNPNLHRVFGLPADSGFTSLLLGGPDAPRPAAPIADLPTLHVLPCGPLPPNPSELLGSPLATSLLADLAPRYDLLLFDTPPAGIVTDAAILAARCDGVLLVASAGSTRRPLLANVLQSFAKVGAHTLGVVLNKVRPQTVGGYGASYYRYGYGPGAPAPDAPSAGAPGHTTGTPATLPVPPADEPASATSGTS